MAANKKQREIAEILGMQPNSYANAESSNFKRMSRERVVKLAAAHALDAGATAQLLAGWEQLPLQEFKQRQAETYEKRKRDRSKVLGYDRIKSLLASAVALLLEVAARPAELCVCDFNAPDRECELCDILRELGMSGWTTKEAVISHLAKLQDKLDSTGKATT